MRSKCSPSRRVSELRRLGKELGRLVGEIANVTRQTPLCGTSGNENVLPEVVDGTRSVRAGVVPLTATVCVRPRNSSASLSTTTESVPPVHEKRSHVRLGPDQGWYAPW